MTAIVHQIHPIITAILLQPPPMVLVASTITICLATFARCWVRSTV